LEHGDRPSVVRKREPRYLSADELERLLAKLRPDRRTIAATMLYAGLRVSEALGLRWCDIDWDADVLHINGTKTAASRADVPLVAPLKAALLAHRARRPGVGEALVFRSANGRHLERQGVLRSLYAAGDAAGLNEGQSKRVGCHDMRHSCAALLFAAGVPAPEVAAILRHANPRVTLSVYAGISNVTRTGLRGVME
jgi:integrase